MNTIPTKARLEAKVSVEIYDLLKQAAAVSGRTLTDFVVNVAYREAKKTLAEHQILKLALADQALLIDTLNQVQKPNASMQEAFDLYAQYQANQAQ